MPPRRYGPRRRGESLTPFPATLMLEASERSPSVPDMHELWLGSVKLLSLIHI